MSTLWVGRGEWTGGGLWLVVASEESSEDLDGCCRHISNSRGVETVDCKYVSESCFCHAQATRKKMNEKIAELNMAIDSTSAQLRAEDRALDPYQEEVADQTS